MRFLYSTWQLPLIFAAAGLVVGCSSSEPTDANEFVSDDPNQNQSDGRYGGEDGAAGEGDASTGTSSGAGGSNGGEGGATAAPEPDDPERLIAEADVVQIDGDTLYALSQYTGLAIIDLADPTRPAILGKKKLGGEPFEMYRVGDTVYAMFRNWGQYVEVDGNWQWVTTSHIEALDVSNPAAIESIGSHEIPGFISDSRMVGDVIYTVSFEDSYCWDCEIDPTTTVTSLDASNPASFTQLDQLKLVDEGAYYGWNRSISVTEDRIYIAGVEWNEGLNDASTIDVVDISDADGALVRGATVPVAGQITNRWQMDEHEGVLRVISQPWDASVFPSVQTFAITSSSVIAPLGQTTLTLPEPESLRAVRFDGERAYAITAMQIDPLFTIDLSDPANPVQRGELEIPGWIYHIEPRGDRLLTLGFDNQSAEGALHVSLFDVSDMANPVMIRRIGFGGDWGGFAEDQDRIHKAFKILPDLGLLAIPFSAWEWSDMGCSTYQSGIQLIDWANDDLVERGVAPVRGNARRTFVHGDALYALSDEQLRSFDIADRDAPEKVGEVALATHVSQVLVEGDLTVRLAADWWTSEPRIEIVPASDPAREQPLGTVDLGAMLADVEQDESCYGWAYWDVRMFAHGSTVVLVWPSWQGDVARVATIDVSNPAAPKLAGHVDVQVDSYSYNSYWGGGAVVVSAGDSVTQVGSKIVLQQIDYPKDEWGYPLFDEQTTLRSGQLRVVDVSNPANPHVTANLPIPAGNGHTGLVTQGDQVLFSHWVPVEGEEGKARFFLDRVDLSNAALPMVLAPINVPGSLVSFDALSQNLLTVDYERKTLENVPYTACYEQFGWDARWTGNDPDVWSEEAPGTCEGFRRHLKVVSVDADAASATLLDAMALPTQGWVSNLMVGDDRAFFTGSTYDYDTGASTSSVYIVGGIRSGELAMKQTDLADTWWAQPAAVDGQTLLALSWPGAAVAIDASDLDAITTQKLEEVPWWVQSVALHDGRALLSLGPWGLHVVDLE